MVRFQFRIRTDTVPKRVSRVVGYFRACEMSSDPKVAEALTFIVLF